MGLCRQTRQVVPASVTFKKITALLAVIVLFHCTEERRGSELRMIGCTWSKTICRTFVEHLLNLLIGQELPIVLEVVIGILLVFKPL